MYLWAVEQLVSMISLFHQLLYFRENQDIHSIINNRTDNALSLSLSLSHSLCICADWSLLISSCLLHFDCPNMHPPAPGESNTAPPDDQTIPRALNHLNAMAEALSKHKHNTLKNMAAEMRAITETIATHTGSTLRLGRLSDARVPMYEPLIFLAFLQLS